MKAVILVPARYPSTRFPGKPLAALRGATGVSRSLIHRSWAAAKSVAGVSEVHVLTDDERIADAAKGFGASVLMTSEAPRNGTERCAEALPQIEADVVVNLQGDAPLTPPHYVEALLAAMEDETVDVATPVLHTPIEHLAAGPDLIKRLMVHRFLTQLLGVLSITVTAMYGMYQNLYVGPFDPF